jgi:hypothetical protein
MAELASPQLKFEAGCPDCGERIIELPAPLPETGDDFDWGARDFDGFRLFMLQELAARFPERARWTPADMEVVLVEALATLLDQLSDMLDRVAAEKYLETARRPQSVRRLLKLIGYDAVQAAIDEAQIAPGPDADTASAAKLLDAFWLGNPHAMDRARIEGPRAIGTQHRMVTTQDYAFRLEDHPLVLRAHASSRWTGSWNAVRVAVVGWDGRRLDEVAPYPEEMAAAIGTFHQQRDLRLPETLEGVSIRTILRSYLDTYRLLGQEVVMEDAVPVGISLSISIRVASNYYQSEVRQAARQVLGVGPGGFFEPGRLAFGEDLHASDIIEALMALDGVESVCLNRFKRLGSQFPDQVRSGRIVLDGLELAVCRNDSRQPHLGYYRLTLHGGLEG